MVVFQGFDLRTIGELDIGIGHEHQRYGDILTEGAYHAQNFVHGNTAGKGRERREAGAFVLRNHLPDIFARIPGFKG